MSLEVGVGEVEGVVGWGVVLGGRREGKVRQEGRETAGAGPCLEPGDPPAWDQQTARMVRTRPPRELQELKILTSTTTLVFTWWMILTGPTLWMLILSSLERRRGSCKLSTRRLEVDCPAYQWGRGTA